MMNRAMEKEKIDVRVDPRSWAEQGREDLAALVEPKMLGGDGAEAVESRKQIEELRQQRQELPAMHLDGASALQRLQQEAAVQIAQIQSRLEAELERLDRVLAKAIEMAVEVKDKVVAVARDVVRDVFGAGRPDALVEGGADKVQKEARFREMEAREKREAKYEARFRAWDAAKERERREPEAQSELSKSREQGVQREGSTPSPKKDLDHGR
jgi:DNA repair exonuclease SbcCD ATPase subunit